MATKVCVLSEIEAQEFRYDSVKPRCTDHEHCTKEEAFDLTAPAFMKLFTINGEPCAEWVGPRQIVMTRAFNYKIRRVAHLPGGDRISITTMQLVPASPAI